MDGAVPQRDESEKGRGRDEAGSPQRKQADTEAEQQLKCTIRPGTSILKPVVLEDCYSEEQKTRLCFHPVPRPSFCARPPLLELSRLSHLGRPKKYKINLGRVERGYNTEQNGHF